MEQSHWLEARGISGITVGEGKHDGIVNVDVVGAILNNEGHEALEGYLKAKVKGYGSLVVIGTTYKHVALPKPAGSPRTASELKKFGQSAIKAMRAWITSLSAEQKVKFSGSEFNETRIIEAMGYTVSPTDER